jgi:fructokinase
MEENNDSLFGGIEAGGTKFVCAVATGDGEILEESKFPTTIPSETIGRAVSFFQDQRTIHPLKAIGVGSFGPLDLNRNSPTFGTITSTPKLDWAGTDLAGEIKRLLDLPVAIDTDVNAAALGEHQWGAAVGLRTFIYLTIGTGIGGGGMVEGELLHGLVHPEMGHIRLPQDRQVGLQVSPHVDPQMDPFKGICPFHGNCFEGLASGPALKARWGQPAENLPVDHPAWELESKIISEALAIYVSVLSPERIILGGGVMHRLELFPMIREGVQEILAGYIRAEEILETIDTYIVPPGLGDRSGILGAIALAKRSVR